MKKSDAFKITIILSLFALTAIMIPVFTALFINDPQKIHDLVSCALYGAEYNIFTDRSLIYSLIFGGSLIYLIYWLLRRKAVSTPSSQASTASGSKISDYHNGFFFCAACISFIVTLLVFGRISQLGILIVAIVLLIIDRKDLHYGLCTYILGCYSLIGLYRLYVFLGGLRVFNTTVVIPFGLALSLFPLLLKERRKCYMLLTMAECLICPLNLLVLLTNRYDQNHILSTIPVPNTVLIATLLLTATFIALPCIRYIKVNLHFDNIGEIISTGACISVLFCNRFDGTGAVMSSDLRHPFENIIGFQQIFELGQTPFEEYIPNSGLYSVIHGAFAYLFGNKGAFSEYHISTNMLYLFVIILTVLLLFKLTDGAYALLLSLLFYVPSYNRYCFLLPIILLLINPKLIKKRRLWLVAYFLTSMFHGLYYPALGFAVLAAFIPLGIYQLYKYVKEKEFLTDLKKAAFWIELSLCVILFALMAKTLIGTARHVMVYADSGTVADALSRFVFGAPTGFFPGLSAPKIRNFLWFFLSFLIPVSMVWFAFALFIEKFPVRKEDLSKDPVDVLCLAALVIAPCICYTFTTTTMNPQSLTSRSLGIVLALVVCLSVYIFKNHKNVLGLFVFSMLVATVALYSKENTDPIGSARAEIKLAPCYYVPEGYIYVEDPDIPKLGKGYIAPEMYSSLTTALNNLSRVDIYDKFMGVPGSFGHTYLLSLKGTGYVELYEIKGKERTQEVAEAAIRSRSVIGIPDIKRVEEYYLLKWLLTSGDYEYDAESGYFVPSGSNAESVRKINKNYSYVDMTTCETFIRPSRCDVYTLPSLWADSFKAMKQLFDESPTKTLVKEKGYETIISFENTICGNDADFLYVELDPEGFTEEPAGIAGFLSNTSSNPGKTIYTYYSDDDGIIYPITCNLSNGKLLIPLGEGYGWLLNDHNEISLQCFSGDESINVPSIKTLKLLRLKGIFE